jgi:hypothetical protein
MRAYHRFCTVAVEQARKRARDLAGALDEAAAYLEQTLSEPRAAHGGDDSRARKKNMPPLRTEFQRALGEPKRGRERLAAVERETGA